MEDGRPETVSHDDVTLDIPVSRKLSLSFERAKAVSLNVSGTVFVTSISTLKSDGQCYFAGLLRMHPGEEEYFVDRDPTHFRHVLNHLRDGGINLEWCVDMQFLDELLREAQFYAISGLVEAVMRRQNILATERRRQPSDHKDYKLIENVPDSNLSEIFRLWTEDKGYNFDSCTYKPHMRASTLVFSKYLSQGDMALLTRLMGT